MKAINLTKAVKAVTELADAIRSYKTTLQSLELHPDNRWVAADAEKATARLKEAKSAAHIALYDIDAAIDAVESRAKVRTISAANIIDDVIEIINRLDIPKKYLAGTVATIDHNAQRFPSAYRYVPMSTVVTVEFDKTGNPRLTDIRRDRCVTNKYTLTLSESAKDALLSKATRLWQ